MPGRRRRPSDPRRATTRVAERLDRETPTRSGPTSTPTRPTRSPTTKTTGPGDVAPDRRADHPLRRRRRHVRHDHRRRPATSRRRTPTIQIIAADPEGSVFSGGSGRPYLVEGVGEDFFPTAWRPDLVRRGDRRSATRRASSPPAGSPQDEGILIGGSGGTGGGRGASRSAERAGPTTSSSCSTPTPAAATCRGCSTTTGWRTSGSCASATSASARCSTPASDDCPPLLYVNPEQTVREAIDADARQRRVASCPVCKNTPPFAAAEVSGAVDELDADGGDRSATRRCSTRRSRR